MDQLGTLIERMIGTVRHAGRIDRGTAEQATGVKLHSVDRDAAWETLEGADTGGALSVELRQPVPGGHATAGPLLIVRQFKDCIGRPELETRYGPLQLTDAPRGRSLDEESSWSRQEPWGRISFGFAERRPDCLSTLVFSASRR